MNIRLPFLISLSFLILISFNACEYDQLPDPNNFEAEKKSTLDITYTTSPIDISDLESRGRGYRYAEDISYSTHTRNKFDIFTLSSRKAVPLVIYVHAGGFTGGDKRQAYDYTSDIRQFLLAGVSFATINYRLLDDSSNGVMTSLNDIAKAVQFFRYHAEEFNIDPERISVFGVSAGAGAAIWLATHDDMANPSSADPVERVSTRISSAVAMAGQATYDLVKWETIFASFGFRLDDPNQDQEALYDFYGIQSMEELYSPKMEAYRKEVDMLAMMDRGDAPLYIYNIGTAKPPVNDGELYHHPFHAMALDDAANQAGIEHQLYLPGLNKMDAANETAVQFTIRHLKAK